MRTTSKTFHNGSSPLTRGTPVQTASIRGLLRFIPAYAGNSSIVPCASKYGPVHPRLRGELFFRNDRDRVACGSSPLTRGTQKDIVNRLRRHRFIPAYAGNSNFQTFFSFLRTVHPRLRGELNFLLLIKQQSIGSSPLTRGTHLNKA